jgi:hypothetical protein
MSIFASPSSFDVGFELLDECYLDGFADEGEKGFLWLWPDY